MNDLYLIGNGFDLAHGLKTSYNDFLLWYLNEFFKKSWRKENFKDELLKLNRNGNHFDIPTDFRSIYAIFQALEDFNYEIIPENEFFNKIIKNYRDFNWVDIEYEYFRTLIDLYKTIELNPQTEKSAVRAVKALNDCFEKIKLKLIDYLKSIEISPEKHSQVIENILSEGTGPRANDKGDKLYVYFNYTSTLDLYSAKFLPKNHTLYIHGKLSEEENPIIFGYGDEMHPYYEKIENLNSNDFLKNIKSFNYFKTNNYQRIMRFLEGSFNSYTVKILGHSCGLSDRVLLNTIFEHRNCKAIKIFYYQKSETENDYFEKTQEISRHFKSSSKAEMRNKIISFDRSCPLLPFKK